MRSNEKRYKKKREADFFGEYNNNSFLKKTADKKKWWLRRNPPEIELQVACCILLRYLPTLLKEHNVEINEGKSLD